jgi:hypothetical protein
MIVAPGFMCWTAASHVRKIATMLVAKVCS